MPPGLNCLPLGLNSVPPGFNRVPPRPNSVPQRFNSVLPGFNSVFGTSILCLGLNSMLPDLMLATNHCPDKAGSYADTGIFIGQNQHSLCPFSPPSLHASSGLGGMREA